MINALFKTEPMNEKEIKEALNLFKLLFKRSNIASYKHANPMDQNCYCSGDDIEGVYFPNSEITINKHKKYNFLCLSKVNNKYVLVFSLKYEVWEKQRNNPPKNVFFVLDDYICEDLESLIFSYDYNKIRERIERNIKDYQDVLNSLNRITRKTRKNGENFKNVLDNFELLTTYGKGLLYFDYCLCSPVVSSVKIGQTLTMYRTEENKQANNVPTVEEVEELIKHYKENYIGYINENKTELKNLYSNFCKLEKIADQIESFKKVVNNWYNFKETFINMI